MGAPFARRCSEPLRVAHLCAARPVRMDVYGGRSFVDAFLGVKGSPVQIRPSRRRSKAGSGFQLPAFGCNGSARALPSVAPAKRSGVPCRPGMLTSDYRHSACSRAGSRLSPADSGELSPGQGVADSDPAVKNWLWATAADGRAPASDCTLSRLSPRRPTSSARAADAPCHRRWGSLPIGQLVANPPQRSSRPLAGPVAFQQC
jgi:hypothetical protein